MRVTLINANDIPVWAVVKGRKEFKLKPHEKRFVLLPKLRCVSTRLVGPFTGEFRFMTIIERPGWRDHEPTDRELGKWDDGVGRATGAYISNQPHKVTHICAPNHL